jgi:tRNA G18 (ribose-2'-O)-methylase SpoU
MKFSKAKFFRLTPLQQQKKCAELIRVIYEELLKNREISSYDLLPINLKDQYDHYNEILSWLALSPFKEISLKNIADQYHFHLDKAEVNLKEHNLLPKLRTGDRTAKENFGERAIFLDNVRSAYNVGSILRTNEALRIGSVYVSKKTPFLDNKKVIKTAMGAAELVPCYKKEDLSNLPSPIIALDTSEMAISLFDFIFPENFTLILGNEEYGISDQILKNADYILEIPMLGSKNSINVACAFAIAAAQIKKQSFHLQNSLS